MNDITQINEGFVYLIVCLVGIVVWFTRLESKNSTNSRDIEKLERRQDLHETKLTDLDSKVMDKLSKIESMVSKIEGRLTNESNARE